MESNKVCHEFLQGKKKKFYQLQLTNKMECLRFKSGHVMRVQYSVGSPNGLLLSCRVWQWTPARVHNIYGEENVELPIRLSNTMCKILKHS